MIKNSKKKLLRVFDNKIDFFKKSVKQNLAFVVHLQLLLQLYIIYNCFSERGTRRKLPNVPNSQSHNSLNTQSLPRPPKGDTVRREQSESRSRDR